MKGNENSFGGHVNINEIRVLDAAQSFLMSGPVSNEYFTECFPNCFVVAFAYSKNSFPFFSPVPNKSNSSSIICNINR
jgi:hypothetical protein